MLTTTPDIEHIIPAATLDNMPAGMKMAVITTVAESLAAQVDDPDTWYESLATYRTATGTDWGTQWASSDDDASSTPSAPDDFHETLPAVLHNWRQAHRALDNTMLSMAMMAERAVTVDKETVLGIPADINKWKTGHGYIADQLGIETRQATQFKDRARLVRQEISTVQGPGEEPQLPRVASAYRAGEIPPENLDTIVRALKHVGKYLRAVNLTPENIREVFTQLDESFRNAATSVTPAELSKLTDNMLSQAAAIIDADGPPPQDVMNKLENSFRYKIVNNKLKVEIVTDIMNLEMFLGIMYAGLNFRAHQNKYFSSPQKAREALGDTPEHTTEKGFLDEVTEQLDDDATPQQILAKADEQLDNEINDREIHAVTMDGKQLTKQEMDRLDRRSRPERLHDIYMAHLRATSRLDPSVQGLSLFSGAPTQLRVAMDYETLTNVLGERLQDEFHLPDEFRRVPGMAGFDPGPSRYLHGLQFAP